MCCAGDTIGSPFWKVPVITGPEKLCFSGMRGGQMVISSTPDRAVPGSSPGRGHCVVFLGKTINSFWDKPAMEWHPIQGGSSIFLVA